MILTKISVFLRLVGQAQTAACFTIAEEGGVSIEAGNFASLTQGNPSAVFDIEGSDYLGSGYIRMQSQVGSGTVSWPTLVYPVCAEKTGQHTVFIRVKSTSVSTTAFSFDVSINGGTEVSHTSSVSTSAWTWIPITIVIPTSDKLDLHITPKTSNVIFDSIHISKSGTVPSTIEYDSEFITLHFRMYEVDSSSNIIADIPVYKYKTTIDEVVDDNWYNFSLEALPGNSSLDFDSYYASALFSSGSNDKQYLIWDYAEDQDNTDPYNIQCSLVYNSTNSTWDLDCSQKYAIRVYSFRDALDADACKIIVPASGLEVVTVQKFDTESLAPIFLQTKVVNIDDSTNKVELSLPDRLVSVIMDQSGSQTWNDSQGLRHEVTRRMIDKLNAIYPGELKYNLITLGSVPIKINFFAVVESDSINTSDTNAVAQSYFADQESGYAGVRIVRKVGSAPTSPLDGEIVTEGFSEKAFNDELVEGETYYYGAYTFDSDGIFSEGKYLSVIPRVKTIPNGAGGFTYRIVAGTGVKRDSNLLAAWHLNEAEDAYAYDFSDNTFNLVSNNDLVWLNKEDVPSGTSGLRLNGLNTHLSASDYTGLFVTDKMTLMAWIYPFSFDNSMTIVSRESSNTSSLSFRFGCDVNGKLSFTFNDSTTVVSSLELSDNEWNHVAVTVDKTALTCTFYINGAIAGSGSLTLGGNYSENAQSIYIGGKTSTFFGKITEVSIHDTIRSYNYIVAESFLALSERDKVLDNGDRIVIVKYSVPEDFNYPGGSIRIIRKAAEGEAYFEYETTVSSSGVPGEPKLVFKGFGEEPSHEADGDIVYEESVTSGNFTVVLPYDYVHDKTYYFRMYTQNVLGNFSLASDSPIIPVHIPLFVTKEARNLAIDSPSLTKVQNIEIQAGVNKNYITWDSVTDESVSQVLVYWSDTGYPVVNNDEGLDSHALLVYSGNSSSTGFVDRNLENEVVSYYTLVTADRYGNLSQPSYVLSTPLADADETGFPLLEVKGLSYEIVNENAVSISWNAPVKFQKDINAWFDQKVALFAQITDEFGSPIADTSNIVFNAEANVNSAELSEDVFGNSVNRNIVVPEAEQCFSLTSSSIGSGFIRGIFRMTNDLDTLSAINSLAANITVTYKIPDRDNPSSNVFEFTSLPIHIEMRNPFAMELINVGTNTSNFGSINISGLPQQTKRRRSSSASTAPTTNNTEGQDTVKILCKQTVPLDSQDFISSGGLFFDPDKFQRFNGCWIRRTRPFVARVVVTYRGQSLFAGANANVAVFEASDPQCDTESNPSNPCSESGSSSAPQVFRPSFSNSRSTEVQPPATSLPLRTGTQTVSDGTTRQVSYVDIPLQAPNTPQAVMLFGKVAFNGFYSRKKMYVVFENILRIETTIEPPESNCIDVSEQQSVVYMINPDSPLADDPIKVPVPNQQIVRWDLRKGRNAKDRPFYSTDNVPSGPGVFSYTRNGVARRVFFGPACGVTWEIYVPCPNNVVLLPELYAIKASVVYDGLRAFEERPAIIYPPGQNMRSFGSRFLMQAPQFVNNLYADGYDTLKITIYHDPSITGGSVAECFRECAAASSRPLFTLSNGQIVEVESGDEFEILYGENLEIEYDEDLQENIFTDNNESIGFAQVALNQSGNSTSLYLRINRFIGRPIASNGGADDDSGNPAESVNSCSCIEIPPGLAKKQGLKIINGRTSIIFNGETRYLHGGGDLKTGVPPIVIDLKEPLDILFVDIRRNGLRVDKVQCDGISSHEFIIEVTFKGQPVPNGTPIFLTLGGNNPEKVILQSDTLYTEKVNDIFLNPEGNERSFASFTVAPFSAEAEFMVQIQAETNYDKKGTVTRSMKACIEIKYDPSEPREEVVETPEGEINNVFSGVLNVYDSTDDEWFEQTPMSHPRGCLSLVWYSQPYGEELYAIGGLDGNAILSYNERYSVETDSWEDLSSMEVPRFYHMSIQDEQYVYVFGGITSSGSSLSVTRSVERYDIDSDTWEFLDDMPIFGENPYGIAMGSCVRYYNKVYIVGGIRKIGDRGSIDAMNDRVLVFDLDSLSWSYSNQLTDQNLTLYKRISPFLFVQADGIALHILGGALPGPLNTENGEQSLDFVTDTLKISLPSLTFDANEYNYSNIPVPRYRGGYASIGGFHYFLGGSNSKSQVLNVFERLFEDSPIYQYNVLESIPTAKTSFGISTDSSRYIYVAGGLTSGRPAGFLQIKAKVNPSTIRLDGKQSATVSVELLNDIAERPVAPIRVLVQGILLFPDAEETSSSGGDSEQQGASDQALRDSLVYPVIFSSNDFTITNGIGSTTMLPRSDDILKKISEIKQKLGIQERVDGEGTEADNTLVIKEGDIRRPYSIRVRVTVVDDFYYGQTVFDIKDNQDSESIAPVIPETPVTEGSGETPTPDVISFNDCRKIQCSQSVPSSNNTEEENESDSENIQVIDQSLKNSDNPVFDLNPPQFSQKESPEISYFSDIEWIPQVVTYVNNGDYEDMIKYLNRIRSEISFGASPLYDALSQNASIMLDDSLDGFSKVIYVNTDNEENLSLTTLNTAIEDIQAIDGFGTVPVIVNNYSVVFPVTLSALVSRTDTENLDRVANETGGQSQTILDASFVDQVVNNSIGRAAGSVGWGMYECVVDLGSNSIVNNILLEYDLYDNTEGNWKIATSEDGYSYSDFSDSFVANTQVELTSVSARYLKIQATLITGFSSSVESEYDLDATGSPALTSINITYSIPTESYIYINPETIDYSPQQIAVTVSASASALSKIQVGATTSNSYNWVDYQSGSQPYVDRFGKIFIPIRYNQEQDETLNEPLENVDGYMWKAKYGRWDSTSSVVITSEDGVIESETYQLNPSNGIIIFNSKQSGPLFISIENAGRLKMGIKIVNMDSENPVSIDGFGYMYNTNVFLPSSLAQHPPSVTEVKIVPSSLTIYQKISLTYKYRDINQKDEDTDQTEIRWFINGVEVEYLRNLREWNDLSNTSDPIWLYAFTFSTSDIPTGTSAEQYARQRQESILKVGDVLYVTIKASDGTLFSDTMRSPSITVNEAPPFVSTVTIKGKRGTGLVQTEVTTATRAFAEFEYFQDGNSNTKSQIIWYVNGREFKRGDLNAVVGGISNNEILVGENKNNVVAIAIGNILEVSILPASNNVIGNPVTSSPVSVQNDPPSARNVTVSPSPTVLSSSALQVTYTYVDVESQQTGSTQRDQSSIKWYRAGRGTSTFLEVTAVQNQRIVASVNTSVGEQWKAEVIPFDGISVGESVQSNIVTIV